MSDYVSFECNHIVETERNNPDEREALAYADIDGYPVDPNGQGTVICRVWMMRNGNPNAPESQKFKYLVDWHDNRYINNTSVLGLVNQAKVDLKEFFTDSVIGKVFNRAYDRYKLQWMIDHGNCLNDLLALLQEQLDNGAKNIKEALSEVENNQGMSVWGSPDDFHHTEWQDGVYMKNLLTGEEYQIWLDK